MTNAALQAALNEFGERACIIYMDNDHRIRFGYPDASLQSVTQIQYKTWGGEDFFGYSQPSSYVHDAARGVTYTVWHRTDCIQEIAAMDEGWEQYRIDPVIS